MNGFTRHIILSFCLLTFFAPAIPAQTEKLFLGMKLRAEVRQIVDEVEQKLLEFPDWSTKY